MKKKIFASMLVFLLIFIYSVPALAAGVLGGYKTGSIVVYGQSYSCSAYLSGDKSLVKTNVECTAILNRTRSVTGVFITRTHGLDTQTRSSTSNNSSGTGANGLSTISASSNYTSSEVTGLSSVRGTVRLTAGSGGTWSATLAA